MNSSSHPAAFAMENKFRAQTMVLTSTPVIFTSCCSIFKASMLYTEQHFYRIDHSNRIRMLSTNPRKDEKSLLMKISRQHAFLHKYYACKHRIFIEICRLRSCVRGARHNFELPEKCGHILIGFSQFFRKIPQFSAVHIVLWVSGIQQIKN